MKREIYLFFFVILHILVSCSLNDLERGNYCSDKLKITTQLNSCLDSTKYDIVDVIPLKLPQSISSIKGTQIKWFGNNIYILDSDYNQSLFVFDDQGNYITKMGAKGHAKNEFIEKPTSFSIDKNNGDVYIYERASVKIVIFDSKGQCKKAINLRPLVPGAIELLDNGNYLMCFEDKFNGNGDKLAIYDSKMQLVKSLIQFSDNEQLNLIDHLFFKDKAIAYNPLLSDSIIFFSNDTVKSVINLEFDCKVNDEKVKKKCLLKGTYLPLYKLENGVQFIDNVEMTDSLFHLSYAYNLNRCNFVMNRTNKKIYNGLYGPLFSGITPTSDFTIKEDQLIYFVTDEDVDLVRSNMTEYKKWEENRKLTPSIMLDIIDKKITTPLIITVKLK